MNETYFSQVMRMDGQVGGYPVRFLEQIVRLSKCLKLKRERVSTLKVSHLSSSLRGFKCIIQSNLTSGTQLSW